MVKKESSILVAGGIKKFSSIVGALHGVYANVLITDKYIAETLAKNC
ncbi:sugar-binding domain-containing protein [Pseudogracilibacillus sp. SE30717A]